jgi:ribosome-binding protein aMBF1 (putative translation factor)
VRDKLDRLASLLRRHSRDRLESFGKRVMKKEPEALSEVIAQTIRERGISTYALGKQTGISPTVIQRFLRGERGLTLKTADELAKVLDLVLVPRQDVTRG